MMYLLLNSFLFTVYFDVVIFHKIFFSCICMSSLSCLQKLFSKMKLVKTSLYIQLKQTNLENCFHILTKSSTEGFNDTVFQHFVDELEPCNSTM